MADAQQLAAMVAFIAFGANFLGGALLLLFNPRHRAIRWAAVFTAAQLIWLLLQGVHQLNPLPLFWWRVYGLAVHFMPALFMSAAMVRVYEGAARWLPYVPPAIALAILPLMADPIDSPLTLVWHGVGWSVPTVLYYRARWSGSRQRREPALRHVLGLGAPVAVLTAIALEGGFVLFALPIMTVLVQFLIYTGVVRHRFYDIEVRAARTGELAAAAAEQDRLALLGELSATIAHEVRNPLTGMRSLTQQIAEAPLDDEKRRRYAGVILGEIARLDRIVGNLTDLSRRSAGNGSAARVPTEVAPLLADLVLLVEARAQRTSVTVRADASDAGVVPVARDALAQALLNLLLNAIAHAPAGSEVSLRAERGAAAVTFAVADAGPGVPVAERDRVFEPFHTSGGTGLGLTVVRRLAEEHGWTVSVADAPAGGAEFRIVVPLDARASAAAAQPVERDP